MRVLVFLILIPVLFFSACEDNKKALKLESVTNASNIENQKKNDSLVSEEVLTEKKPSKTSKHPKITNQNVVAFFTEYGANHPETRVKVSTAHGDIEIELYKNTPLHRANFIYLVKEGYFNETFFHRVVPNFIIQAGNSDLPSTQKKRYSIGHDYLLPAEIKGRKHRYGSISGSKEYRENPDKKSAPFEFFIFLGPQSSTSHLNGNYTVFGKVTKGMTVVEKIANLPADEGQWPMENVYITAEVISN